MDKVKSIKIYIMTPPGYKESEYEMELAHEQIKKKQKGDFSNYLLLINKSMPTSFNNYTKMVDLISHKTTVPFDTKARIFIGVEEMSLTEGK